MIDLCERCETNPALKDESYCAECLQNMAEALYERSLGESLDEQHIKAWRQKHGAQ